MPLRVQLTGLYCDVMVVYIPCGKRAEACELLLERWRRVVEADGQAQSSSGTEWSSHDVLAAEREKVERGPWCRNGLAAAGIRPLPRIWGAAAVVAQASPCETFGRLRDVGSGKR